MSKKMIYISKEAKQLEEDYRHICNWCNQTGPYWVYPEAASAIYRKGLKVAIEELEKYAEKLSIELKKGANNE